MAQIKPDVKSLRTATMIITLNRDQVFCENPKSWEIWQTYQDKTIHRVKRIDKKRVLWVAE